MFKFVGIIFSPILVKTWEHFAPITRLVLWIATLPSFKIAMTICLQIKQRQTQRKSCKNYRSIMSHSLFFKNSD